MKPVVFYRKNDKSLRIFANGGSFADIKLFYDCVNDFIKKEEHSNSESISNTESNEIKYSMFSDKTITSKMSLNITEDNFEKLVSFLRNIYYVYED